MEQLAFLRRVVQALEQADVAYAVTGSWASITFGLPRTTHDLDLVVSLSVEQAAQVAEALPPPIYADSVWMQEAAALGEFFNIIDAELGVKVDCWPLKDDEYSRAQFQRRRREDLGNTPVWMLAPEDVILAKLQWYQLSESQQQLNDCIGVWKVWKVQQDTLDLAYLRHWAHTLGLTDLLARVTAGARA
jgi:hypothetical protein